MFDNKKAFVLWSGGLDSTFLIYKLLSEGYYVRTGYINLTGNGDQTRREQEAIEAMIPYFAEHFPQDFIHIGKLIEYSLYNANSIFSLNYPPLFMLTPYFVGSDTTEVAIGYVMNDDACSFIKEIETIYYSLRGITGQELPKLSFPLLKYKKETIWNTIPKELQSKVTWCELTESIGCDCPSCKRMRAIGVENKVNPDADLIKMSEDEVKDTCDTLIAEVEQTNEERPEAVTKFDQLIDDISNSTCTCINCQTIPNLTLIVEKEKLEPMRIRHSENCECMYCDHRRRIDADWVVTHDEDCKCIKCNSKGINEC